MIRSNRLLLISLYISYCISVMLLLIASFAMPALPPWGGYLDVAFVIIIVVLSIMIFGRGKANPNFESGHRAALYILPISLLGMWIFRDALDFDILLPGLAWRTFFFLHILPYSATLWNPGTVNE